MSKTDPYNFKKIVLPNGLTVFFSHIPYATKTVIYSAMAVGSFEGLRGASHFLEHYLIEQTEQFKDHKEFDIFLENFGGRQLDLFTNCYKTCLGISINSKYLEKALIATDELFFKSTFNAENFEREKKVILEEIKARIPRKKIVENYEKFSDEIFDIEKENFLYKSNHPYVTIGSPEEIEKMSLEDLKNHFDKYYAINNFTIFIGSNLKEKEVLKNVKNIFSKYKPKKIKKEKYKVGKFLNFKIKEKERTDEEVYERKMDNSNIELFCVMGDENGRETNFAKEVIQEKLFDIVRTENGLSYNPYVRSHISKWDLQFYIGFDTTCKDFEKCKTLLFRAIDEGMKDKDLFARLKKRQLLRLNYNESVTDIVSNAMYDYFSYGKIKSLKDETKEIENTTFPKVKKVLENIKNNSYLEILKSTK
jgi:predicted Zn-dependent peptidase